MRNAGNHKVSWETACNHHGFKLGIADAVQRLPWRDFVSTNDQMQYERARHFVAYWRGVNHTPRAPFVRGKTAQWLIEAYAQSRAARIIV